MPTPRICSIPGCDKLIAHRAWCSAHYNRWKRHGDPLAGRTSRGELKRYFHEVVIPFAGDECLPWPYARNNMGYGKIWHDGRLQHPHRLACEVIHGPPPTPDHEAAHSCGKGHEGCCNPRHVRWATTAENFADKTVHGTDGSGEQNSNAKLTADDVRRIRSLEGQATQREIAAMFGIAQGQVNRIIKRQRWASIK